VSSHPNVRIAERLWMATSEGDAEKLAALFAPDVSWRSHSAGDLSGECKGREEVLGIFARAGELVDDLRLDLIDICASDRSAVVLYRVEAERGDDRLDTEVALIIDVVDGLIVTARTIPADAARNHRFWSSH